MTMPPLPEVLGNGFTPLQAYLQDNGEDHAKLGVYRFTGVILAERPEHDQNPDRWATWTLHYDLVWGTTSGSYFSDQNMARFDFGLKVRRSCWGATMRGLKGDPVGTQS